MSFVQRLLREPLVWFLVAGGMLFAAAQWLGNASGPNSTKIVITRGLVDHLASGFAGTWQRPPTEAERKGLIDEYIKDEIASREAVAMGLDRDDTIIRRRLRQKLEFLLADDATPVTDAELEAWISRHPEAFRTEPRVAFRQVYVRPDRRGGSARADAQSLLARLRAGGPDLAIERMGDGSMLPMEQPLAPARDVARTFGEDFTREVLAIAPGQWMGPLESPFGLHLVLVRVRADGALPSLAEVRPLVEREVLSERRSAQVRALYDRLLAKYELTLEPARALPAPPAKASP